MARTARAEVCYQNPVSTELIVLPGGVAHDVIVVECFGGLDVFVRYFVDGPLLLVVCSWLF